MKIRHIFFIRPLNEEKQRKNIPYLKTIIIRVNIYKPIIRKHIEIYKGEILKFRKFFVILHKISGKIR